MFRPSRILAAELQPVQIFHEFFAARSPGQGLADDLRSILFNVLVQQLVGVIARLLDFAGHDVASTVTRAPSRRRLRNRGKLRGR